jgi:hypothetical protein
MKVTVPTEVALVLVLASFLADDESRFVFAFALMP